jgi:hypothetical protein
MSWIVGTILSIAVFLALVPRKLLAHSTRSEKRVLGLLIVARLMMPLVAEYLGSNSDRFFRAGGWDSNRYHSVGIRAFEQLRAGLPVSVHAEVPGTGAIELATGYLYSVIGSPNRLIAVYVFTIIATVGNLLFWLATRDRVVDRRGAYAAWVLLAPTLLFWSSTLGKEAPILLGLGCLLMALRLALTRAAVGRTLLYVGVGLLAIGFIRPFVALILFSSVGLAAVLTRTNRQIGERPVGRLLLVVITLGGLVITIGLSSDLLGTRPGQTVLDAAYERAESTSTGQGTSSYESEPVRSPLQVPGALAIVLLRPFIWETQTGFQILASLESLAIFTIAVAAAINVFQGRRRIRWDLLTMTSALYVIMFSSAISTYGNFGLVVRQRIQVWQFVIFLAFCTAPVLGERIRDRAWSSSLVR